MKDFRLLKQEATQKRYKQKDIFQEGNVVMNANTGEKGTIIRSGVNYVIAVTEDQKMFRAWVKDIREVNIADNINKEKKSIFFTNGKTETNHTDSSS